MAVSSLDHCNLRVNRLIFIFTETDTCLRGEDPVCAPSFLAQSFLADGDKGAGTPFSIVTMCVGL